MRAAYLINMVRPDALVALGFLSRRMHCSTEQDFAKLEHLMGYIAGTQDYGITLRPGPDLNIYAYIDSSFATTGDYKSVSGAVIMIGKGGAPVFAKSSRQSIVTKSSMECELVACSDLTSQVIHLRNLMISIGIPQDPATVYQDNKGTIFTIKNGRPRALLVRHIGIRTCWISERCTTGEIVIVYCPTELMVADALTKAICGTLFDRMREWLMGWVAHPGPMHTAKGGNTVRGAHEE